MFFMKILSLFSGAGGMDLGFERAGFEIPVANEFDKKIHATYEHNHPDTHLIKGSISDVEAGDILPFFPDGVHGIIGGPPCQSWSVAGAGRGLGDERGGLFLEYIRLLGELKPLFFVAENVKGMLSLKHKEAVSHFIDSFRKAGYRVSLTLVDACDFGVPQNRERVFYVGFRDDFYGEFAFPSGSTGNGRKRTLRDAIWDLRDSAVPAGDHNKHNKEAVNCHEYFTGSYSPVFMSRNRVRGWDDQAFTVQASGRQCQLHPQAPPMVKAGTDSFVFEKGKEHLYRRLTVREVARIQGFPDDFQFIYDDVNMGYKMIGNAVPVNLAFEIASAIRDFINMPEGKIVEKYKALHKECSKYPGIQLQSVENRDYNI